MGILLAQAMLTVGTVCLVLLCTGVFSAFPAVAGLGVSSVLLVTSVRFAKRTLLSTVAGFEGACIPVRVSGNRVLQWLMGAEANQFRQAHKIPGLPVVWLSGPEFSGYARNEQVTSMERPYGLHGAWPIAGPK